MNWKHLLLIDRGDQVGDSFKTLVDREIRERRRDERRLAEHRMITHQLQARIHVLPMHEVIALLRIASSVG